MRDLVRDYVTEHLAADDAVLVLDEIGFVKQGKASCGVARQFTGSAGKIANCQIGVFAAYVSSRGHAFVDRTLYLPKAWTDDAARMRAAHIPAETTFLTRPQMANVIMKRAIAAEVLFAWVVAGRAYIDHVLEVDLRRAGIGYVLGVDATHRFASPDDPLLVMTAESIARGLKDKAWKRPSVGQSTDGKPLCEWAHCLLEYPDAAADEESTSGLLVRRCLSDGHFEFFTTWCPARTAIDTLVTTEGHRQTVKQDFDLAKELGLDHNETRSWHGWHRHVSLVMLAFATREAVRLKTKPPPSSDAVQEWIHPRHSYPHGLLQTRR